MKRVKNLDEVNRFIISELIKNGRIKYTALARKLNITPAAVKERVDRLINDKVIKVSALLNTTATFPTTAIIGVEGDSECVNMLIRKLRNCPLVISLTRTSGMHNLIIYLVSKNLRQLESFLNNQVRSEPGIKHVEVNIGDSSVIPEFQQVRLFYFENTKDLPCRLKKSDKNVCINCPIVEEK